MTLGRTENGADRFRHRSLSNRQVVTKINADKGYKFMCHYFYSAEYSGLLINKHIGRFVVLSYLF